MDGRRNGNKGWQHCDIHGTNWRGEWGCKKCEITKARVERDAALALLSEVRAWDIGQFFNGEKFSVRGQFTAGCFALPQGLRQKIQQMICDA